LPELPKFAFADKGIQEYKMQARGRFALMVLAFICLLAMGHTARANEKITIAAASDLKFALEEIILNFKSSHPEAHIRTVYGSSGKFSTQIRQGAPYDIYFSADISYPRNLYMDGFGATEAQAYGLGRIVLWSRSRDVSRLTLSDLADPAFQKIAIANPLHAPYGKRAEEALKAARVWDIVEPKLVYGENVAQAAQYVQSGNAQVGIIALSLVLSPDLAKQGNYVLISDKLHQPLQQGFIITKRASDNALAREFARFMASKESRGIMVRYGFGLPGEVE
jgi:molybdate transport system substrate-binding protein